MSNHTAQEQSVNLVLSVTQVNLVLRALGELPLKEVMQTFKSIEHQANADLQRQKQFMQQPNTDAQPASQEQQAT